MQDFIERLRCPVSHTGLRLLNNDEIQTINNKINAKEAKFYDGNTVQEALEEGLIDETGKYIYVIKQDIFSLLKDSAILNGVEPDKNRDVTLADSIKSSNQLFYDQEGWEKEGADFEDAKLFEDLRPVVRDYHHKCHMRLNNYIGQGGKYIVDVASGPIQYDEYLTYHENYEKRVCVDFSISALLQAKKKLGDRGLYVLGDITNLPFKNNSMDAVISLHTIYHVPRNQQLTAFNEIYRSLSLGRQALIIYSWSRHSKLFRRLLFWVIIGRPIKFTLLRIFNAIKSIFKSGKNFHRLENTSRGLYFYSQKLKYWQNNLKMEYDIVPWRSADPAITKIYIHSWLGGKRILNWLYKKEEKQPERFAKIGVYPMFVLKK